MAYSQKKLMEKLLGLSGAVSAPEDVHGYVLRTRSPSLNFCFGNGHGLPAGYTVTIWGPRKCGKSVVCNDMIGQLHADDPEAFAIKFNTELREKAQLDKGMYAAYGIDPNRYVCYETNRPDNIFDRIEKDMAALVQEGGMKLKLVIIDSLTQIQGRRGMNADTIMTQQIGDNALTNQEGLKRILPVQRELGFGLVLTAHVRAQMDPVEQMRGNKFRPAVSNATEHHSEYNLYLEPNLTKDGRVDMLGKEYIDHSVEDMEGKGEQVAHRVRCRMVDSSIGPKKRHGEFTFDYHRGVVNTHEEVFKLGVGWNIIERPNNLTYVFNGVKYPGKPSMLEALKGDPELCKTILNELRRRDRSHDLKAAPETEESPDT